jgi:hypothetical protein
MPITVSGQDITGLTVVTQPTATASGRILFEGAPPPSSSAAVTVVAVSADPNVTFIGGGVRVRDDWTFEAKGMTGRRLFRGMGPGGWVLKSVTLGTTDVTDSGVELKPGENESALEITMARTAASIEGTVQTAAGKPTSDYVVVAFASDSARWGYGTRFIQSARPNQTGRFVVNNLPPSDYLVVALDYLEPGEEGDAELLEKLRASATRVSVEAGAPKSLTLKVVTAR